MPQAGPQTLLLSCPCDEIGYGGARGGGKTDGMLGDAAAHVTRYGRHSSAIIFRQTYPELEEVIRRSWRFYQPMRAQFVKAERTWKFKNGSELKFRFLEREEDADLYQGHEFTYEGYDEAGNVKAYETIQKLKACLRSPHSIPTRMVLTFNPQGKGHRWIKQRFITASPALVPLVENERIGDVKHIFSRVFIPAKLEDNPALTESDPTYEHRLKEATAGKPWLWKAWREGDFDAEAEKPGALWTRRLIDEWRVTRAPELARIVIGLDPSASDAATADEAGIVADGIDRNEHRYVLKDRTVRGRPKVWASAAIKLYHELQADCIVAEANQGGLMVQEVIEAVDPNVPVKLVHASRGKRTRAEPISAEYERGLWHHVGYLDDLEDEMCLWLPQSDASPNRMDAHVWAGHELRGTSGGGFGLSVV